MPSLTYTFTFDTDAQGWSLPTLFQTVTWTGGDGNDFANVSAPGCLDYVSQALGGGGAQVGNVSPVFSWQDTGVPADGTVTSISIRARRKFVGQTGDANMTQYRFTIRVVDNTDDTFLAIQTDDHISVSSTDWVTIALPSPAALTVPYSDPTRTVTLQVNADSIDGNGTTQYELRMDTFEITVTYTVPGIASVARSSDPSSAYAILTDISAPVGGGTLRGVSAGVVAHALLTDLCDSAIEVYLAGAESGDDLSATAYSLPTVFTLPNPVLSGHNYILQLPATDLAKFASGRLGFVKFRYAGNDSRDCAGDVILGGIELIYNEKTVT